MKKIVFVGCPNTGKSALINSLAKSNLKTGNWSGVTVQRHEASYQYHQEDYLCIDLPGLYGFNASCDEERIAETFFKEEKADCLVNVVDSCSLLNQLYCTLQCRLKQIPMILVFNFEDERIKNGIQIDFMAIQRRLSIPVISMSSFDGNKALKLKAMIEKQARQQVEYRPLLDKQADFLFTSWMKQNHCCLKEGIEAFEKKYPHIMEKNRLKVIASFNQYISKENPVQLEMSSKIDQLLMKPIFSVLFLSLIFFFFSFLVFDCSGLIIKGLDILFEILKDFLFSWCVHLSYPLRSFIIDGIFNGIQAIFSILPIIAMLTLSMSLLEESGIMARVALFTDPFARKIGLSGKALISLILGFGCNVPAITSCIGLENEQLRRKTALLIPMISCGARLPIYFCFIDLFFSNQKTFVLLLLYGSSILAVCFCSLCFSLKEDLFSSMMELPYYRYPKLSVLYHKVAMECWSFLLRAFKTVFWVLLLMWLLMHCPTGEIENSYLVILAQKIQFLFIPLGFGQYWQLVASLFPSFLAKETVVGFLLMFSNDFSFLKGCGQLEILSFCLYCLFSIPCVMTVACIVNKFGYKHACKAVGLMLVLGYLISLFFYQFFSLFF